MVIIQVLKHLVWKRFLNAILIQYITYMYKKWNFKHIIRIIGLN